MRAPLSEALTKLLYVKFLQIAARKHRWAGRPGTLQPTAPIEQACLQIRNRSDWQS